MTKEIFTTAETLQLFLETEENRNEKQVKRYLRKVNNVVIDFGYSCKITIDKITSTTIKLREAYGPLVFTNYVDIEDIYKYIQYKSSNIKSIDEFDQTENLPLTEKKLEFTDVKIDIEEDLEMALSAVEFNKLRLEFHPEYVEIFRRIDDAKLFTIEINEFGRGTIKHHLLGVMQTNNLDFFNSSLLITFGKIVEKLVTFNFSEYYNCQKAITYLQRQSKLTIPELPQELEIREFLHGVGDVVIEKSGIVTTITKKSRIKVEITSIKTDDNLTVYKMSFKAKDVNSETLYDLVKHVIFLI